MNCSNNMWHRTIRMIYRNHRVQSVIVKHAVNSYRRHRLSMNRTRRARIPWWNLHWNIVKFLDNGRINDRSVCHSIWLPSWFSDVRRKHGKTQVNKTIEWEIVEYEHNIDLTLEWTWHDYNELIQWSNVNRFLLLLFLRRWNKTISIVCLSRVQFEYRLFVVYPIVVLVRVFSVGFHSNVCRIIFSLSTNGHCSLSIGIMRFMGDHSMVRHQTQLNCLDYLLKVWTWHIIVNND
jgi:hypothetical protein